MQHLNTLKQNNAIHSMEDCFSIVKAEFEKSRYDLFVQERGKRHYELTNHLGNVLTVISDKRILVCNADTVSYSHASIISATDYSPFGAPLAGRVYYLDKSIVYDTTAWEKGWEPSTVSFSYVGNRLKVDASTLWAGVRRGVKTIPGHKYVFRTTIDLNTTGSVYIFARRMSPNNTSGNIAVIHPSISGSYEVHFTALDTLTYLHVEEGGAYTSGTVTFYIENAIVQDELLNGNEYRFRFNGQERDDEIAGVGNIMTAEFWEYDTRLGRRWNVDPVVYPWQSGYATFNNNPNYFSDPFGLEGEKPGEQRTTSEGCNEVFNGKSWQDDQSTLNELVVCGDRLNCQTSNNSLSNYEASMPPYLEKGQAAHRAFTEYWRRIDPNEREWKANKSVFGRKDPTRPDLTYDDGRVGGVWELKPAFSSHAETEAIIYAQSLNMVHKDGRFAPGTVNGAPAPLIPGPLIDLVTGRTFIYTIDNFKGAVYYTELPLSQPTAEDIKIREPNPIPVLIPFSIPLKLIDKLIKVPILPILIIDPGMINGQEQEMY